MAVLVLNTGFDEDPEVIIDTARVRSQTAECKEVLARIGSTARAAYPKAPQSEKETLVSIARSAFDTDRCANQTALPLGAARRQLDVATRVDPSEIERDPLGVILKIASRDIEINETAAKVHRRAGIERLLAGQLQDAEPSFIKAGKHDVQAALSSGHMATLMHRLPCEPRPGDHDRMREIYRENHDLDFATFTALGHVYGQDEGRDQPTTDDLVSRFGVTPAEVVHVALDHGVTSGAIDRARLSNFNSSFSAAGSDDERWLIASALCRAIGADDVGAKMLAARRESARDIAGLDTLTRSGAEQSSTPRSRGH